MVRDEEGNPVFPEELHTHGKSRMIEDDDYDFEDETGRDNRAHVNYWNSARALVKFTHEL